jgi:hypothetical protein
MRGQLLGRGMAAHAVDRMVRTGRLLVLRRGLYQIGPLPAAHAPEAAAVLGCGPEKQSQSHERGGDARRPAFEPGSQVGGGDGAKT